MENKGSDTFKSSENGEVVTDTEDSSFFIPEQVRECKKKQSSKPLDTVKVLLKERGMKQSHLADKIGIARQTLHHYLSGYWGATVEMKVRISRELGVDSSVIWDLKEDKK